MLVVWRTEAVIPDAKEFVQAKAQCLEEAVLLRIGALQTFLSNL